MAYADRTSGGANSASAANNWPPKAKGEDRISVEAYAVAMIDELERPRHIRQCLTVEILNLRNRIGPPWFLNKLNGR